MRNLNQKGQGTTEYIVILAIIVGIAVTIFMTPLKNALNGKVASVVSDINSTNSTNP